MASKAENEFKQFRNAAWIEKKHEVTSNDIRREASKHLKVYNEDAAHMLLHHRVVW